VNGAEFLGFDLLRPGMAIFVLAAPFALLVGWLALRARTRARAKLVDARHLESFLPGLSLSRARFRVLLATGGLLFLAFALVGPVRGYTLREVRRRGLDLVVCLDTSRSMLVQDLKPDRLERAKREVSLLLDHLKGDRVALVAFSGDVRNVAPLTHDRDTLRWFLNSLSPRENVVGGTDIGGALEHALSMFDGRTGAHEAIVLLTDGEDLEGKGLAVAAEAKTRGIRIYVVGMATESGGKIPEGQGWVKDEQGQEVVSHLDDQTLAKIADVSGGAYLSAEASALPLEEIHEKRLSRLEGRELGGGKEKIPHDRYQWPLVLGVLCMLGAAGLSEKRPGSRARRATTAVVTKEQAA
jgi:Ca-activated chloride channel family protein